MFGKGSKFKAAPGASFLRYVTVYVIAFSKYLTNIYVTCVGTGSSNVWSESS